MSGTNAVALCLALLLTAGAATGQELREVGPPFLRGACFDPVRLRVVAPGIGNTSRDWDGTAWQQVPDLGSRGTFSCFLSPDRLVTLTERPPGGLLWTPAERLGHAWQDLPIAGGPSSRFGMARVHDAARGEILLFGGRDLGQGTLWDETWTWNGTAWSRRTPAHAPTPRAAACLAFDANRQRVVLFGGGDTQLLDDTWEWDGTDWTAIPTPNRPPAAWNAPMAFDPVRGLSMLVAPSASGGGLDLWEYDGVTWIQRAGPPGTQVLPSGTLVFDAARNETLLLGHFDAVGYRSRTVAWNGTAWTLRADLGTVPEFAQDAALAPSPSGTAVLRFGGNHGGQASDTLWQWDGATWTRLASGGPPARAFATAFTIAGAFYVFGGMDPAGGSFGDTWRWNGSGWAQVANGPSPRHAAAAVGASALGHAVLFGGNDQNGPNGETWTFDGVTWQPVPGPVQPPARSSHTMAYDPGLQRVVLFAGVGAAGVPLSDTWLWDGSAWQQRFPTTVPARPGSMAFDAVRQRIVHGGDPTYRGGLQLFEFDGTNWQPLPAVGDLASAAPLGVPSSIAVTGPAGRVQWFSPESVVELLPTPASATSYGTACGSTAPWLTATCLPRLGEPGFALEVTNGPPFGPVAIAGADTSANVPLLGCVLWITPGQATVLLNTSGTGLASYPLPIPAATTLLGQPYYFQAAAWSPGAANGFELSAGLQCVLGL